jgi:carboxyl-terminal processing protease
VSRALIAGAVLGAGLVTGGMLIQSGAWREADASPGTPRLLDQVMARVINDYIDTLSIDQLHEKAAFGMIKELEDPYSALLSPDRAARLKENTTGRYAGVGVELDLRDGYVTVIAPLANTPADSAGIRPGDRIIAIDRKSTMGLSMEEVQQAMRGPAGSSVELSLERGDEDHSSVTLRRRVITFHPVQRQQLLAPDVGYLALATFSEQAADEVRRAVDSLRRSGARSLILDLRENPGGLLEQGIAVADLFLDASRPIARTRGRIPEDNHEFVDRSSQAWATMPVVALVDSGTASAAEIVAGALQDNDRAVIVGSPTYGKGSAQGVFTMAGGNALKLTTARWYTPAGRTIERDSTAGGITPDVVVRQAEMALDSVATSPRAPLTGDPVVTRALDLLRGVTSPVALRARVPRTSPGTTP